VTTLSDDIDWIAAMLSHATANENQWRLIRLAAEEGGFSHGRGKERLGLSSGGLQGPLAALMGAALLEKEGTRYRLTDWGRNIYDAVRAAGAGRLRSGTQLVLVSRGRGVDPTDLLNALQPLAAEVWNTRGKYDYAALTDARAGVIDQAVFSIEALGATAMPLAIVDREP
jgi:hypothetical protein